MEVENEVELINFGKFTKVFLLIKTAQNSYGLKNGDYMRYRNYCTRKIVKLRKSLALKFGNKTKFIKKDLIQEKPNEPKILQITLFNAEKCWAAANQTKYSQARKASQKSRAKFFSIKKLRKAFQWSGKLARLCQQRTDETTKLEAEAYQLYMEGLLRFEEHKWSETQTKLIACREIISDLAKASDSLTERIFKEKIDQIQQTIKFCNFKISKGKELSITEIIEIRKLGDSSLTSLMENLTQKRMRDVTLGENTANEIRFGSEKYPIKQEVISQHKLKIDSELQNLEEIKRKLHENVEDQQLYEQLLSFYSDVILLVEEAVKLTDLEKEDPKKKEKYTQGEIQILKKISLLFQQIKMNLFIDRNTVVFRSSYSIDKGRKSTPQTLAKLLTATTTLLQELAQIIKQKGIISNSFQIEETQKIDAKNFYLRTLRLMFVGQVYFNNDKIKEAYGLWGECERCLRILLSKRQMTDHVDNDPVTNLVELGQIVEIVRVNRLRCIVHNHELEEVKQDRLNKQVKDISLDAPATLLANSVTLESLIGSSDTSLTLEEISQVPIMDLPGRILPIPTRPIFFDIYETAIIYPDLQHKIKATSTKASWWGKLFK